MPYYYLDDGSPTDTYYLFTADDECELEAVDDREAVKIARRLVRDVYGPNKGFTTYWAVAALNNQDGELVDDWIEAFDPAPTECDPPVPELGTATIEELEGIFGAPVREEDGHAWARPHSLLGGRPEDPGVRGSVTEDACVRCGMLRAVDANATDPKTGTQGLRSVEYEPNLFAVEVKEAWYDAHGLTEPELGPAY